MQIFKNYILKIQKYFYIYKYISNCVIQNIFFQKQLFHFTSRGVKVEIYGIGEFKTRKNECNRLSFGYISLLKQLFAPFF